MKKQVKSNALFLTISLIVFIAMFSTLVHFGNMKQGFHLDEFFTYGLSNSYYAPFPYKFGEWLSPSYYMDYLTVNAKDAFEYGSVYYNQVSDVHPPIYYFFIHTLSSMFQGEFSKWIGISANIVFFYVTALTIFCFMKELIKDKWIALMTTAFWGFSVGAISSVMFIRMYVLLTLWFVLFLFLTFSLLNKEGNFAHILITIYLITVAGTLTHYYFLIGAFFISFSLCILLLLKKKWKVIVSFSITMIVALVTAYFLFPAILSHIFGTYRGNEAFDNFSNRNSTFLDYWDLINHSLFEGKGPIILLTISLALFILILYSKIRLQKNEIKLNYFLETTILLVTPVLLYMFMIQKVAPYVTYRYIYPIFPAIVISIFYISYFILNHTIRNKYFLRSVLLLFIILTTLSAHKNEKVQFLYESYQDSLIVAKEYGNNDALVIESKKWEVTEKVLELKEFNNILPLSLNEQNIELPEDNILLTDKNLVVFIDNNFDQQSLLDQLKSKYNYSNSELISEYGSRKVYYLN